MEIAEMFTC